MTRLLWVDGRLSWPLVIVVAYISASVIIVDFVWRIVVLPFDTLLLCVVTIGGSLFVLLGLLMLLSARARRKTNFRKLG